MKSLVIKSAQFILTNQGLFPRAIWKSSFVLRICFCQWNAGLLINYKWAFIYVLPEKAADAKTWNGTWQLVLHLLHKNILAKKYSTRTHSIKILANQWNSAFLTFSFIIEGTSKKVLKFFMPQEPIYDKNFCFKEQNAYYEYCHIVQTIKKQ